MFGVSSGYIPIKVSNQSIETKKWTIRYSESLKTSINVGHTKAWNIMWNTQKRRIGDMGDGLKSDVISPQK